jgi:hypothetical protein
MLQYLKLIPGYVLDLAALLLGPKRFLAHRNVATSENLTKALLFFLISSGIALIFRAYGLESPTDFATLLLRSTLAWGASLLVIAAVITAAWAIVRKPVAIQSVLLTHAYVLAITLLMINVGVAMEANLLAMYRPELYGKIRAIYRAEQFDYGAVERLAESHPLRPDDPIVAGMQVIQWLTVAVIFGWLIATWGAYRRLSSASRTRSALAFVACFVLCLPLAFVGALITRRGFSLR